MPNISPGLDKYLLKLFGEGKIMKVILIHIFSLKLNALISNIFISIPNTSVINIFQVNNKLMTYLEYTLKQTEF